MIDTRRESARRRSNRGQAYILALSLVFMFTITIAGTLMLVTQQLKTSKTERNYERSLQMAEAGLNIALNKLTYGDSSGQPGHAYSPTLGEVDPDAVPTVQQFRTGVHNGSYVVTRYPAGGQQGYWAATIGSAGSSTDLVSYGWSNGVVRRVTGEIQATALHDDTVTDTLLSPPGDYILYPITSGTWDNNTSVYGNVGTNGAITLGNNTLIRNGVVSLNGPSATISQGGNSGFQVVTSPSAVDWPTVDDIAQEMFPSGGLAWLATHNDNSRALLNGVPGVPGNAINFNNTATVSLPGKSGGANYYLTSFYARNNCTITVDNALGPVNIWLGPSGGAGSWTSKNNVSLVTTSADPSRQCRVYVGFAGVYETKNNAGYAVGVYAYNKIGSTKIGTVVAKNNAVFCGSLIANAIQMKNNAVVDYRVQFFRPHGKSYYRNWRWREF